MRLYELTSLRTFNQKIMREAERSLSVIEAEIRSQLAGSATLTVKDSDDVVIGHWACPDSPIQLCVYDRGEDPVLDHCLYCGLPDERK